jgi:membrane-associated protein
MEALSTFIDVVLHLNVHLDDWVKAYGAWVYVILFVVVFCETGLVATPFLPGDSLLFAAGAVASGGRLNVVLLGLLLIVAAVLGDATNYSIGKFAGEKLTRKYPRIIKPEYLARTSRFYERYGGKTIVLARFVPIVRTFAPFVAGIGRMRYARFASFNIGGAVLWVGLLVPAGYFFANVPVVKQNFSLVVLGIIVLSVLPMVWEYMRRER